MQRVQVSGFGQIEFPDSMSEDDVVSAIENDILPMLGPEQPLNITEKGLSVKDKPPMPAPMESREVKQASTEPGFFSQAQAATESILTPDFPSGKPQRMPMPGDMMRDPETGIIPDLGPEGEVLPGASTAPITTRPPTPLEQIPTQVPMSEALKSTIETWPDRIKRSVASGIIAINDAALMGENTLPKGSAKRQAVEKRQANYQGYYEQAVNAIAEETPIFNHQPYTKFVTEVATVVEDMVPAIGGGLAFGPLMGQQAVTLGLMGSQVFGPAYMEGINAGETPGKALFRGFYKAGVETLTEKIPVAKLFERGQPALRRVLDMTVYEGAQEAASSILSDLYDKGTITPDMTMSEALGNAGYEFLIGAGAGGVLGTAAAGAHKLIEPGKRENAGKLLWDLVDAGQLNAKVAEEIARNQMLPPQPGEIKPTGHKQGERVGPRAPDEAVTQNQADKAKILKALEAEEAEKKQAEPVKVVKEPVKVVKEPVKVVKEPVKVEKEPAPEDSEDLSLIEPLGLSAYHGSPHKFDKFDIEKIGTGEGAQAYGHGLYFAESEGVAKSYQSQLSGGIGITKNGTFPLSEIRESLDQTQGEALNLVWQNGGDYAAARKFAKENSPEHLAAMDFLEKNIKFDKGSLYEVDIPDEAIAKFLDWDAPLSEQPESVRGALKKLDEYLQETPLDEMDPKEKLLTNALNGNQTGAGIYKALVGERNEGWMGTEKGDQLASEYLNSLGIPGIKYFDQQSRGEGEGTRNLVVFDAKIPKILKRNNVVIDKDSTPGTVGMSEAVNSHIDSWSPGDTYVPLVEGMYSPIPGVMPKRSKKKPIRREDVLIPFLKALKVPLYQGNVRGKSRLGFYIPKHEAVRIKKMNDLEVAAHEIAHLLDDRLFGGFRGSPNKRPWLNAEEAKRFDTELHAIKSGQLSKELKGVSYDKKKVYEGFAEYVRLWMTQPDQAKTRAPEFTKWWEAYVPTTKYGKAITKAKDDMRAWFAQEALDRAASKIGAGNSLSDALDNIWDDARQSIFDDLHGILIAETELTGTRMAPPMGVYETARLSRAAYSIVDGALRYGAPVVQSDGSIRYVGKGLRQILNQVGGDLDNWTLYAVGRSASELKQQGRENLFSQEEIDAMLALETPKFSKAFEEYQTWNNTIVNFAIKKGLISQADRDKWQRRQYIPFNRVGSDQVTRRGQGIEGQTTVVKRLTGGTGNLNNILDNMVQNATKLVVESLRNEARRRAVDLALKTPGGGRYLTGIAKRVTPVTVDKEQIKKAVLKSLGLNEASLQMADIETQVLIDQMIEGMDAYTTFWKFGQPPKKAHDDSLIVAVMRKGKPFYYEIGDPLFVRAFEALNPRTRRHGIIRGLQNLKRFGQGTITFTFDFMARNIARDTLHAAVFSRHGFKPFKDSMAGFATRINVALATRKEDQGKPLTEKQKKDSEIYRDFIANGAGMSSYFLDEQALEEHLTSFYARHGLGTPKGIFHSGKRLWYAIESIGDAFEMSTRIGEFNNALKRGEHPRHASYLAREISTDFAMRGDSDALGFMYDTVMFLKAALNGLDRVYRGFTKDVNRASVIRRTGYIATISAILVALNRDNDCYNDMEDWEKDSYWHFFIPKSGKDGSCRESYTHLKYPKIWEIGAIASMAERTMMAYLDAIKGKDVDVGEYGKAIGHIMMDQMKFDYIPYAFEPLYEQAINKNRFTGREIETKAMEDRLPFSRYRASTPKSLVRLAEAQSDLPKDLQMSPVRAEALIRGYLNTYGMYGLMLAEWALYRKENPSKDMTRLPVIKSFVKTHPGRTKYETEFWDMVRNSLQVSNTINDLRKKGREELAEKLAEDNPTAASGRLTGAYEKMTGLNREMQRVYRDPEMTPDAKKKELIRLRTERNKLSKDFIGTMQ